MTGNDANMSIRCAGNPQDSEGCDALTVLSDQYGAEWNVRHPGKYVADHSRLDVTLISESVTGLAEKLRAFTELIRDLP